VAIAALAVWALTAAAGSTCWRPARRRRLWAPGPGSQHPAARPGGRYDVRACHRSRLGREPRL